MIVDVGAVTRQELTADMPLKWGAWGLPGHLFLLWFLLEFEPVEDLIRFLLCLDSSPGCA